jgi:hypothetical protein
MPDWINIFGKKEAIEEAKKIYVVEIKEFIEKYNIEPSQKKKLIINYLDNFFKRRLRL